MYSRNLNIYFNKTFTLIVRRDIANNSKWISLNFWAVQANDYADQLQNRFKTTDYLL